MDKEEENDSDLELEEDEPADTGVTSSSSQKKSGSMNEKPQWGSSGSTMELLDADAMSMTVDERSLMTAPDDETIKTAAITVGDEKAIDREFSEIGGISEEYESRIDQAVSQLVDTMQEMADETHQDLFERTGTFLLQLEAKQKKNIVEDTVTSLQKLHQKQVTTRDINAISNHLRDAVTLLVSDVEKDAEAQRNFSYTKSEELKDKVKEGFDHALEDHTSRRHKHFMWLKQRFAERLAMHREAAKREVEDTIMLDRTLLKEMKRDLLETKRQEIATLKAKHSEDQENWRKTEQDLKVRLRVAKKSWEQKEEEVQKMSKDLAHYEAGLPDFLLTPSQPGSPDTGGFPISAAQKRQNRTDITVHKAFIKMLRGHIVRMETELMDTTQDRDHLQERLTLLEGIVPNMKEELNKLGGMLQDSQREMMSAKKATREILSEREGLLDQIEQLTSDLRDSEKQLKKRAAKDKELERLRNREKEMDDLKNNIQKLKSNKDDQAEQILWYKELLEQANEKIAMMEDQVREKVGIEEQALALQKIMNDLISEITELRRELDDKAGQIYNLETALDFEKDQYKKLKEQLRKVEHESEKMAARRFDRASISHSVGSTARRRSSASTPQGSTRSKKKKKFFSKDKTVTDEEVADDQSIGSLSTSMSKVETEEARLAREAEEAAATAAKARASELRANMPKRRQRRNDGPSESQSQGSGGSSIKGSKSSKDGESVTANAVENGTAPVDVPAEEKSQTSAQQIADLETLDKSQSTNEGADILTLHDAKEESVVNTIEESKEESSHDPQQEQDDFKEMAANLSSQMKKMGMGMGRQVYRQASSSSSPVQLQALAESDTIDTSKDQQKEVQFHSISRFVDGSDTPNASPPQRPKTPIIDPPPPPFTGQTSSQIDTVNERLSSTGPHSLGQDISTYSDNSRMMNYANKVIEPSPLRPQTFDSADTFGKKDLDYTVSRSLEGSIGSVKMVSISEQSSRGSNASAGRVGTHGSVSFSRDTHSTVQRSSTNFGSSRRKSFIDNQMKIMERLKKVQKDHHQELASLNLALQEKDYLLEELTKKVKQLKSENFELREQINYPYRGGTARGSARGASRRRPQTSASTPQLPTMGKTAPAKFARPKTSHPESSPMNTGELNSPQLTLRQRMKNEFVDQKKNITVKKNFDKKKNPVGGRLQSLKNQHSGSSQEVW